MATTSVRQESGLSEPDALLERLYRPNFPPGWAVPVAAGTLYDAALPGRLLARRPVDGTAAEGPQWFATVAPGLVAFRRIDPARAERAAQRAERVQACRVALGVAWRLREDVRAATVALRDAGLLSDDQVLESLHDPLLGWEPRARITEWSAKSRANMVRRFSTLDFEPMLSVGTPAMVTITLPCSDEQCPRCVGRDRTAACTGWVRYAPNGAAFKRLFRLWRKRFARAWGREWVGLWKLEFQARGAPHLHMLMVPPRSASHCVRQACARRGWCDVLDCGARRQPWREWFARSWADTLGVRGATRAAVIAVHEHRKASADYAEGLRATDPRRVSVYFLKHNYAGDKEYQHVVPAAWRGAGDGPGRFWGNPGVPRADVSVPLTDRQAVVLARTLRRWERARGGIRKARVWRVNARTGEVRPRVARRRVCNIKATAGFLVVNDGPAVALMLAGCLRT